MNKALKTILETAYRYEIDAQRADDAEAEVARKHNEMARYFDLSLHWQLPETCWALEKWDEAKFWYRHNAQLALESRAWHAKHSTPDYPREALSELEASSLIKAGNLKAGREHLRRAIAYWREQPNSGLTLTRLGLHAAQAGLPDLATYARSIIDTRQALPGEMSQATRRAQMLLHYEPAQASLLLGRWDEFLDNIKEFSEGVRFLVGKPHLAFSISLQEALTAAYRGLSIIALLHEGKIEPTIGRQNARRDFEMAMLNFYRFSGQVDWDLYFMRLNSRFAHELGIGQQLNSNPFVDNEPTTTG